MKLFILLIFISLPIFSATRGVPLHSLPLVAKALQMQSVWVSEDFQKFVLVIDTDELEPEFDKKLFQKGEFLFHAEAGPKGRRISILSGFTIEEARDSFITLVPNTPNSHSSFSKISSWIIPSAHASSEEFCEADTHPEHFRFTSELFHVFGKDLEGFSTYFKCFDASLEAAVRAMIEDMGGLIELAKIWKYDEHLQKIKTFFKTIGKVIDEAGKEIGLFIRDYHNLPFKERFPILCAALGNFLPDVLLGKVGIKVALRSDKFTSFLRGLKDKYPSSFRLPPVPPNGVIDPAGLREWVLRATSVAPEDVFDASQRVHLEDYFRNWRRPSFAQSTKSLNLTRFHSARELENYLKDKNFVKVSSCLYYPECGPNPVKIDFYLHRDGGVVKVKPDGDPKGYRKKPHASKIVMDSDVYKKLPKRFSSEEDMKIFAKNHLDFNNEVMKVTNDGGTLLPKSKNDMIKVYPTGSSAFKQLEDVLMEEAHWNLLDRRRSQIFIFSHHLPVQQLAVSNF